MMKHLSLIALTLTTFSFQADSTWSQERSVSETNRLGPYLYETKPADPEFAKFFPRKATRAGKDAAARRRSAGDHW